MVQIAVILVILFLSLKGSKDVVFLVTLCVLPFHFFLKSVFGSLAGGSEIISSWKELVFLILLARILIELFHGNIELNKKYPLLLISIYILFSTFLVVIAPNMGDALVSYKNIIFPLLCFFTVTHIEFSKIQKKQFFKWITISALVVCLVSYLQHFFFKVEFAVLMNLFDDMTASGEIVFTQSASKIMGIDRMYGPFAGPNELGLYMELILLMVTCGFFMAEWNKKETFFMVSAAIFSLSVLLLTYSRVSWFIFLSSLGLYLLLREKKIKMLILVMLAFFSAGIIVAIAVPDLGDIVVSSVTLKEASAQDRSNVFSLGLNKILQNPTGYGLGSIQYSSANPRAWPTEIFWWLVLGEQSLIFGALLLYIYGYVAITLLREDKGQNIYLNVMPVFMLILIVAGFGSVILFEPIFQVYVWSFVGLAYNKSLMNYEQSSTDHP
jgi:O-antigen ligase